MQLSTKPIVHQYSSAAVCRQLECVVHSSLAYQAYKARPALQVFPSIPQEHASMLFCTTLSLCTMQCKGWIQCEAARGRRLRKLSFAQEPWVAMGKEGQGGRMQALQYDWILLASKCGCRSVAQRMLADALTCLLTKLPKAACGRGEQASRFEGGLLGSYETRCQLQNSGATFLQASIQSAADAAPVTGWPVVWNPTSSLFVLKLV